MPTAPFGLAYGLGAGMAIAPQQMFTRQEQTNQLAMQGLQQQLMQHQVAQQQAEDQAFSQPIQPQMQSITQTQPGFESAMAANKTLGGMKGPNGEDLALAAPTETVQKPVEYVTPYQKMAYEYGQRADKLAKMGFGRSAMALQQQAAQYGQMHQQVALQHVGLAIRSNNPSAAIPYLNSLGQDFTDIKIDPSNPNNLLLTRGDGSVGSLPKRQAELLAVSPEKAPEVEAMIDYKMGMLGAREADVDTRQKAQATRDKAQADLMRHRLVLEQNARTNAQNRLNAPGQVIQQVERRKANIIALAKESGQPIPSDADAENQAWNFVKSSAAATGKDPELANSWKVVNSIQRANQGMEPEPPAPGTDPNSPEARQYAEWKQAHDLIMDRQKNGFKRGSAAPKAGTPQPKQNYEGEISPSGAYKFSGGQWIPNK